MTDGEIAWRDLAAQLRDQIMAGDLRPGERMPTEEQLKQETGLSRTTIRRAVLELRHEGLVDVQRPWGTFVKAPDTTLVLRPGDSATCEGTVTVTRADGTLQTRPAGTRIVPGL